jgi:uncharacterized protein (TIGR03437 family)
MAMLEGRWLADATVSDPSGSTVELGGVQVKVNGGAVPLLHVSPATVAFLCPASQPGTRLNIVLQNKELTAPALSTTIQAATPGIFSLDGTGGGQGSIVLAATSHIAMVRNHEHRAEPAKPGDVVRIYGTGIPVDATSVVRIAGVSAEVLSIAAVAGRPGVVELITKVPGGAAAGRSIPLVVEAGSGLAASNVVSLAIAPVMP